MPVPVACGSSSCSFLVWGTALMVSSGFLGVSGAWVGPLRLPLQGMSPPNCPLSAGMGQPLSRSPGSGCALSCWPHSLVRCQVSGKMAWRSTATTAGSVTSRKLQVAPWGLDAVRAHGHVPVGATVSSGHSEIASGPWDPVLPARGGPWQQGTLEGSFVGFSRSLLAGAWLLALTDPGEPSTEGQCELWVSEVT